MCALETEPRVWPKGEPRDGGAKLQSRGQGTDGLSAQDVRAVPCGFAPCMASCTETKV